MYIHLLDKQVLFFFFFFLIFKPHKLTLFPLDSWYMELLFLDAQHPLLFVYLSALHFVSSLWQSCNVTLTTGLLLLMVELCFYIFGIVLSFVFWLWFVFVVLSLFFPEACLRLSLTPFCLSTKHQFACCLPVVSLENPCDCLSQIGPSWKNWDSSTTDLPGEDQTLSNCNESSAEIKPKLHVRHGF